MKLEGTVADFQKQDDVRVILDPPDTVLPLPRELTSYTGSGSELRIGDGHDGAVSDHVSLAVGAGRVLLDPSDGSPNQFPGVDAPKRRKACPIWESVPRRADPEVVPAGSRERYVSAAQRKVRDARSGSAAHGRTTW